MTARSTPQSCLFVATIFLIFLLSSAVDATCYCKLDGRTIDCSATEKPCANSSSIDNGAQLCCVTGDTCGEDMLCHFTKEIANTSGYYLGGCTDPLYEDPVCQQHCIDASTADVAYNTASNSWSCCAYPNNTVSCEEPRSDTSFKAISPQQFPFATSSTTASSSSTSTSPRSTSGTTAAMATTTAENSSQSSSGLSTGATAGIAVACTIVGLALIGLVIFFVLRRRRRNSTNQYMPETPHFHSIGNQALAGPGMNGKGYYASENPGYGMESPNNFAQMHEIDGVMAPQQLYGSESRQVAELPS